MKRFFSLGAIIFSIVLSCGAANAAGYDIYVFNHFFTGKVITRHEKMYVPVDSIAKAINLPVKEKDGAICIGTLPPKKATEKILLNGKAFTDVLQTEDGQWLVELKSFVLQSGNKFVANQDTGIIDILPGNTPTLTQTEAEALVNKANENVSVTSPASDLTTFHSEKYGISMKYPKSWEKFERIMGTVVVFRRPPQSESEPMLENLNLIIKKLPEGKEQISLDQFFAEGIPLLKKSVPTLEVLDTGATTVAGNPAVKGLYHYVTASLSLKLLQVIMLKDGNGYIFSYTGSEQNFDKYMPMVQSMLDSFRFHRREKPSSM